MQPRHLEAVNKLGRYAKQVLATVPNESRVLLTAHDAFNYFGRAYGFEVIGIQGISTESEAGLKRIRELVDLLVQKKIGAVFVESSVSDRNVRALIEGAAAREHKVIIGGELFSDAMGPDGSYEGTYIGMIDHNVTTIARALGGDAPERGHGRSAVRGEMKVKFDVGKVRSTSSKRRSDPYGGCARRYRTFGPRPDRILW